MSEKLKTLKDLKEHYDEYYDEQVINNKHSFIPQRAKILKSELKAEILKWVKSILNENTNWVHQVSYKNLKSQQYAQIDWIKHFFNLTEDDLNSRELEAWEENERFKKEVGK